MAISKPAVSSPQIFTSDPIEQIYAKGTLDPHWGGTAFAYLNAANNDREGAQAQYLQNLKDSNNLAARLASQEESNKLTIEALKAIPSYVDKGYNIDDIPLLAGISRSGGKDPRAQAAADLVRALNAAKAAEANAKAQHAGDAGADKYVVEGDTTNTGTGNMTFKGTGRDPVRVQAEVNRRMAQNLQDRAPGGTLSNQTFTEDKQARMDRARREHAGVK